MTLIDFNSKRSNLLKNVSKNKKNTKSKLEFRKTI